MQLPEDVQYAWPHVSGRFLYVASSNTVARTAAGTEHHLSALRIGADGSLSPHGQAVRLPMRPVHVCTDAPSAHALVAFPKPSALRVYGINPDGTLAGGMKQEMLADTGIHAHQIRVTADNRLAVLVTRGNDPAHGKPEEPGALKVFRYHDGRLGKLATVAPGGGYGFGARHLDFHPTRPWVYVSIERQNRLMMFRRDADTIGPEPLFTTELLQEPGHVRSRQQGGAIHVHPAGHLVYGVNRAFTPQEINGRKILPGGENNIVVFRIDPGTGEPVPVQHIDTRGVYCRTFHVDPGGRMLVAANMVSMDVADGGAVRTVPASLALFRIAPDGRLEFLRKHDVEVGGKTMIWMGMA